MNLKLTLYSAVKESKKLVCYMLLFLSLGCQSHQAQQSSIPLCLDEVMLKNSDSYQKIENKIFTSDLWQGNEVETFKFLLRDYLIKIPTAGSKNSSFFQNKLMLAEEMKNVFNVVSSNSNEKLNGCLEKWLRKKRTKESIYLAFFENINNINTMLAGGELPEELKSLTPSQIFERKFKDVPFSDQNIQKLILYALSDELYAYTEEEMLRDIEKSKYVYGFNNSINPVNNHSNEDDDSRIQVIVSEDTEGNSDVIVESIIEEVNTFPTNNSKNKKASESNSAQNANNLEDEVSQDIRPNSSLSYELHNSEYSDLLEDEVLDLNNRNWTSVPDEVWEAKLPTSLTLFNNNLTHIPDEIGKMVQLDYLDLQNNNIGTISSQIGKLVLLEVLYMKNNRLFLLPEEIGNLKSLTHLDLENNRLKKVPSTIGNLKNLESLDLRSNELQTIPQEIGKLQSLEYLDLSFNKLSQLPESLNKLNNLKSIRLEGNNFNYAERQRIRRLLSSNCKIYF